MMNSDLITQTREMGNKIHIDWKKENFNEEYFPQICSEKLNQLKKNIVFDPLWISDWFLDELIPHGIQKDHSFSQLPISLYRNERFLIELLVWTHAATAIHQHSFSGSFMVVHGSSLHVEYQFSIEQKINSLLQIGKLNFSSAEILKVGDIRPIRSGNSFIHGVFHLARPTCTLVVRTHQDLLALPQMSYFGEEIALAVSQGEIYTRQKQLIKMLKIMATCNRSQFRLTLKKLVSTLDTTELFIVLRQIFPHFNQEIEDYLKDELDQSEIGRIIFRTLSREKYITHLASLKLILNDEEARLALGTLIFISNSITRQHFLNVHLNSDSISKINNILEHETKHLTDRRFKQLLNNFKENIFQ